MVHALKEIWRVLKPGGILVDLRPIRHNVTIDLVHDDDMQLISVYSDEWRVAKDKAADDAIATVKKENLFKFEDSAPFEYIKYYDTCQELVDFEAQRNPPIIHPDDVVNKLKITDSNSDVILRVGTAMHLTSYRRL